MSGEDIVIHIILTILLVIAIGGIVLNIVDFLRPSNQNKRRRNKMTSGEIKVASSGQIADMLTEYNNWRRGKPPYDEPCSLNLSAYELGLCIDRAIEILRGESLNTKPAENVNNEKVVYNGVKVYEALKYLRDASREFHHLILNSKHNEICDKYKYAPAAIIRDAIATANAALNEPPRNCDKCLTPKDAMLAHLEEVYEGEKVEFGDYEWCEFVKWLFAEAKGETDEQK